MVGFSNPAQVHSSVSLQRAVERKYKSDTCGPQPHRIAAAAANAIAAQPTPPLADLRVEDGTAYFRRNFFPDPLGSSSRTAGPSEPRIMDEPGPDERTPLDLLDEDFRPPVGYQPKYENTLTMTAEERTETDEVQEMLLALELLHYIDAMGSDVDTVKQSARKRQLVKQFNALPWDDLCDILLPSTLPSSPASSATEGRRFRNDCLRNRIAQHGGLKKSVEPGKITRRTLDSLSHHHRRNILLEFETALDSIFEDEIRSEAPPASGSGRPDASLAGQKETMSAEKAAMLKVALSVPGIGNVRGFGSHLGSNAVPSMSSRSTAAPVRATPMDSDDITEGLRQLMIGTENKADYAPPAPTESRTGKAVNNPKTTSTGLSARSISADIPLLYDPGKYGMPAGPSSPKERPSSPAQSAKKKKKNKKKKKKSGARTPPSSPPTLASRSVSPQSRGRSADGHIPPGPSPAPSSPEVSPILKAGSAPVSTSTDPQSSLPVPPLDLQYPLPPRPSFASADPAMSASTSLESSGASRLAKAIAALQHSPEALAARFNAIDRQSRSDRPIVLSIPPPPLGSPPPLSATGDRDVNEQELPPVTQSESQTEADFDVEELELGARIVYGNTEERNAAAREFFAMQNIRRKAKAQSAQDVDMPLPITFSPPPGSASMDLRTRLARAFGHVPSLDFTVAVAQEEPWAEISSGFADYVDSPFDMAFGDALRSGIEPVDQLVVESIAIEQMPEGGLLDPIIDDQPSGLWGQAASDSPINNQKAEPELDQPRLDDDSLELPEPPRVTPPRESRRTRVYSPAKSDSDYNPWVDVGDATFESTNVFTPFTPDDEALFASPGWTSVRRGPLTPPSPTRALATNDNHSALLASAPMSEGEVVDQTSVEAESPTLRLAASAPGARLLAEDMLEPRANANNDVLEADAVDLPNQDPVKAAEYVPYEELFIELTGNIVDRKAGKAREARETQSGSTPDDPFVMVTQPDNETIDNVAASPDSFVQVSPTSGHLSPETPIASTSYIPVPSPTSSQAKGKGVAHDPRPLATVLEEDEEDDDDFLGPTVPWIVPRMKFPPGSTTHEARTAPSTAGPSGSHIIPATGDRDPPLSHIRSTADWEEGLMEPLAMVVYDGPERGLESEKQSGKSGGKQAPTPSAEDLLYSSPHSVAWDLKPAGPYGRLTTNIYGMIGRHLFDDECYYDHDRLAWATRDLEMDDSDTHKMCIRVNDALIQRVTLPSIKTAYKGRHPGIMKRQDDSFRAYKTTVAVVDRCKKAKYAVIDDLIRFDLRGTIHKRSAPLLPNMKGIAIKPRLFERILENERLPDPLEVPTSSDEVSPAPILANEHLPDSLELPTSTNEVVPAPSLANEPLPGPLEVPTDSNERVPDSPEVPADSNERSSDPLEVPTDSNEVFLAPKKLPWSVLELPLVFVACALDVDHTLCISPPPFLITHHADDQTKWEWLRLGTVARFIQGLVVVAQSDVVIYHDFKAGDYAPPSMSRNTIYELAKSPIYDTSFRHGTRVRSKPITKRDQDYIDLFKLMTHYKDWYLTFDTVLRGLLKLPEGITVTFRYANRLFPAQSDEPKRFSDDFVERLVLSYFAPTHKSEYSMMYYVELGPGDRERLYQVQIRENIQKEGRGEEFKAMLEKMRKVVKVDNSGDWGPCRSCFKSPRE